MSLKEKLREAGLLQADLAAASGYGQGEISRQVRAEQLRQRTLNALVQLAGDRAQRTVQLVAELVDGGERADV